MKADWLVSYNALNKVINDGAYSNLAIKDSVNERPACNRAFVSVMVKGVLRRLITLDHYIDRLASKGMKSIKKRPLLVIRMGLYAVCYMDGVPDHAAVSEAVSLARSVCRDSAGFVNAILRSFIREKENVAKADNSWSDTERLSIQLSYPEELVKLMLDQYGPEHGQDILEALNGPSQVFLRCNLMRTSREKLISELIESGCAAEPDADTRAGIAVISGDVIDTESYRRGDFTVQSSSSLKAVEILNPQPGSRVLDMCAAPGGKSTAMAEIMGNHGQITACDIHPHRLELIEKNAERLGITIIRTSLRDASAYDETLYEAFDTVLADVPCSGLGVIASKPEIRYSFSAEAAEDLAGIQRQILENAYRYVRAGGMVMYSTCTLNRRENDQVISDFLSDHEFVDIVEKDIILPYNNKAGFFYCLMRKNK